MTRQKEPPRLRRPAFDLRLWPVVLGVWGSSAIVIITRSATHVLLLVLFCAVLGCTFIALSFRFRWAASGAVTTCSSGAALAATASKVHRADHHDLASWSGTATKVTGTLATDPKPTKNDGTDLLRLSVDGLPGELSVFANSAHTKSLAVGDPVVITGQVEVAARPGLSPVTMSTNAPIDVTGQAHPLFAVAAHARRALATSADAALDDHTAGLVTGMVFGDVRLQPAEQRQELLDAGLAHLSAVSGANVTIVCSCALAIAALLGASPQLRVLTAAATFGLYVLVTGPEPSVLRASVMGSVGLVAIVASRRHQPLSALAAGIIGLLFVYPDLAVNWGFGLSVGVTLGLILVAPLIQNLLQRWQPVRRLPAVLVSAVAVGVAAELVSIPLLIGMSGKVPVWSLVANILAAPAVAPVTVLGLIAAVVVWLPVVGEFFAALALLLSWPFAAWIDLVASTAASQPVAVWTFRKVALGVAASNGTMGG